MARRRANGGLGAVEALLAAMALDREQRPRSQQGQQEAQRLRCHRHRRTKNAATCVWCCYAIAIAGGVAAVQRSTAAGAYSCTSSYDTCPRSLSALCLCAHTAAAGAASSSQQPAVMGLRHSTHRQ